MKQISVLVNLIVKADNAVDAESIVASRLNQWFGEDLVKSEKGFPRGTLLFWGVYANIENSPKWRMEGPVEQR